MIQATSIQQIIQDITDKKDVSLEQIAGEIGVSSMTVYRWKKGQAKPKSRIVLRALTDYINRKSSGEPNTLN